MYFRQVLHEERSCASYLVGCPTLGLCAVVDPQGDVDRYVEMAESNAMVVAHVLETHIHADHVSGARGLAEATGAELHLGRRADVGFPFRPLAGGATVAVGNRTIEVIETPGHTPEHVALVVDDWFVLTGDTLFVGDVGRVDLALADVDRSELGERARALHASLRRLLELRDDVEVYPGHYAGSTCGRGMDGKTVTTIGRERRHNPALQLDLDAFVDFQLTDLPPVPGDFRRIKQANVGARSETAPV
ncbi:MAG: MBL fold metallo-hydrolase [Actinomycetota bacterium]